MAEQLRSVGLDVGTTTTQLIFSELTVENKAGAFSVPELDITRRKILYKSPVHFTPLLQAERIDGNALRQILLQEYQAAGIRPEDLHTGAVIITGETSRKENARAVLHALSDMAGDFVVATAGPDLESVLAAKGAGAVEYSDRTGQRLLHMDIGGGTSNLALIEDGKILQTGCLNVGGRLIRFREDGSICYLSPVLQGIFPANIGDRPSLEQLQALADQLVQVLEMAAGLRETTDLYDRLQTAQTRKLLCRGSVMVSFSGGIADCIETTHLPMAFGDLGPILGQAIARSRLCQGPYRLGKETIRATVIGAGSHSTQLSGSTVFYRGISFPLKNLPVVTHIQALSQLDTPGILALDATDRAGYAAVTALADEIALHWPPQPILVALKADLAKALGHALALRLPQEKPILCIDHVNLTEGSYLDIGHPVSTALPVVVKTLILNK